MGNKPVTLKIVDRTTAKIKETAFSMEWSVVNDTLSTDTSTFVLDTLNMKIEVGDFLIAEEMGNSSGYHRENVSLNIWDGQYIIDGLIAPLYIGIVQSYDLNQINATDSRGICDNKVVDRTFNGTHPSQYLFETFKNYVRLPGNKLDEPLIIMNTKETIISGNTGWKRPIQNATSDNMLDVMRNMQTYYQTILTCIGYKSNTKGEVSFYYIWHNILNDLESTNTLKSIKIDLSNSSKYVKDTIDIYVKPSVVSGVNCTILVQPGSGASTAKYVRYMQDDGTITSTLSSKVRQPLTIETLVYDDNDVPWNNLTDALVNTAVGPSMSKDTYAHEITFDYIIPNEGKIDIHLIREGQPVKVRYMSKEYDSYISSWTTDSKSGYIRIKCGNIRTNLPLYTRKK